jgi:ABC-type polysaccharide/polyol phosphate export permease
MMMPTIVMNVITIMTLVMTYVAQFNSQSSYVLYVFAGWLPWNFLVNAFLGSGAAIINNESILRKIYLPKILFPLAITAARFIDFSINLSALFLILIACQFLTPSLALLALPLAILLLLIFTIGVTLALSAINVYIRDTSHMITVLMQWGFYLTPIIYELERIPPSLRCYFILNPVTHLIRLFQSIVAEGQFPSLPEWGVAILVSILSLVAGYGIFKHLERNLIFKL